MLRGLDNASCLDVGIKGIAGTDAKPAPKGSGKDDLTLGGNLGLHGKTILPSFSSCEQIRGALFRNGRPLIHLPGMRLSAALHVLLEGTGAPCITGRTDGIAKGHGG